MVEEALVVGLEKALEVPEDSQVETLELAQGVASVKALEEDLVQASEELLEEGLEEALEEALEEVLVEFPALADPEMKITTWQ